MSISKKRLDIRQWDDHGLHAQNQIKMIKRVIVMKLFIDDILEEKVELTVRTDR